MKLEINTTIADDVFEMVLSGGDHLMLMIDYASVFGSVNQYRPRIVYSRKYHLLTFNEAIEVNRVKDEFIATQNVIRRLKA